jgi:cold shock CspA family protein
MGGFYLLTFGVLLIYGVHRVTTWMHGRGWIRWKMRRGTSSGLGNAVLGAQMIFQPQIREVLEIRLEEPSEAGESGDPPEPGAEGWGPSMAADDRRERGHVRSFDAAPGRGQITSDEFYDVLFVQTAALELREGQPVEYSRQIQSGPMGPRVVAVDARIVDEAEQKSLSAEAGSYGAFFQLPASRFLNPEPRTPNREVDTPVRPRPECKIGGLKLQSESIHPMQKMNYGTLLILSLFAAPLWAQQAPAPPAAAPAAGAPKPEETEVWEPVPKVVTPGTATNTAPDDAIVLFDGKNLDQWVSTKDKSAAGWTVADGIITVNKAAGNIETKRSFTNYQLHIEWRIPEGVTGTGQARGNSGVFLASTGPGDAGYELQVLDSYNNKTYVNGQAASIYKQSIPLANASRKPGEWQSYDVMWTAPTFNADGSVKTPAYVTALHNGVLVQNHFELKGETLYIGKPVYKKYESAPIKLQAHGDPSPPISFRNIWIRDLPASASK